jgi:calcineurin-like phosphoesterase family protein
MASSVWFTADTHFGHNTIAQMRGFADAAEHDEEIIRRWNATVAPGDQVVHLGDVAMCPPAVFWPLVDRLHGEIHLITGNHDKPWPGHRDAHRRQREWLEHFASVQAYARRSLYGRYVLLSHLPYSGDSTEVERYPEYRLPDCGVPLLCGHVHDAWKVHRTANGTPQINVGVDVWGYAPVSIDTVTALLGEL